MEFRYILVLISAIVAIHALDHGEGVENPIIEFFEAPVRSFKTKVAGAVAVEQPAGKSAGTGNGQNNGWFRGKGLGNWLAPRSAMTTTTATKTTPEVVLNTPAQSTQQIHTTNKNSPNRRRINNRNKMRNVAVQNRNGNGNANGNRKRYNPVRYANEDVYDDDDYDTYNDGRRYEFEYESIPDERDAYDDEDDEDQVYLVPARQPSLRRRQHSQRKSARPNSSYMQPFHDIPMQARPIRYRQNLPASKPIGNNANGNNVNGNKPNRNPANHNAQNQNKKKNKNKNKNKPTPAAVNKNPAAPQTVEFVVQPQGNGQLPVLIPVDAANGVPSRKKNKNKNKNKHPQNDPYDPNYQNYQYFPIPISAFNQPGVHGIPQIQVIAQHTHTFRPQNFPTEVILGPGFDEMIQQQPINDETAIDKRKKKPTKQKVEQNQNAQNQKIILQSDDQLMNKDATISTIMEENMENTGGDQKIFVEQVMQPETTVSGQAPKADQIIEIVSGDDGKMTAAEMRSVDRQQHIILPRHLFPIFGASSLVEVANNGKFLLKTGRDLKIPETVASASATPAAENVLPKKSEETKEDAVKLEEAKPEAVKSELAKPDAAKPTEATKPEAVLPEAKKPEENKPELTVEKPSVKHDLPHHIPVTVIHDKPILEHSVQLEPIGKSVSHVGHKPVIRSEIVHEKPNGHFIVKSGIVPHAESRSAIHPKISDSDVQTIKVIPAAIVNSRAI